MKRASLFQRLWVAREFFCACAAAGFGIGFLLGSLIAPDAISPLTEAIGFVAAAAGLLALGPADRLASRRTNDFYDSQS